MGKNICILDPRLMLLLLQLLLPPASCQLSKVVTYHLHDEGKNWTDALKFCRKHHTDLATFKTGKENDIAVGFAFWIGLYQNESDGQWKWSQGDEVATNLSWHSGEPNAGELCGFKVNADETLWNDDCSNQKFFMCSSDDLVLVRENKTWEEALNHCRSLGGVTSRDPKALHLNHTYDLATLSSDDDQRNAAMLIPVAATSEVWTGLRFLAGQWFWVGGEAVQSGGLPSCPGLKSCGVLDKNVNSLQIRDCSERRHFFCYRKPKKGTASSTSCQTDVVVFANSDVNLVNTNIF